MIHLSAGWVRWVLIAAINNGDGWRWSIGYSNPSFGGVTPPANDTGVGAVVGENLVAAVVGSEKHLALCECYHYRSV